MLRTKPIYQQMHLPSNFIYFQQSSASKQNTIQTDAFGYCVYSENINLVVFFSDVGSIVSKLYPQSIPPIMLVGHSMGGAICVHIADMELIPSLIGCVVIDVVEGTAMEALASMQSFLRSRPKHFKSIQQAIEWSIRSGQIRNAASAKVSMPGQIVK